MTTIGLHILFVYCSILSYRRVHGQEISSYETALIHPPQSTEDAMTANNLRGLQFRTKMGLCEYDCDFDWECQYGLLCAAKHSAELESLGYHGRKANCPLTTGSPIEEVCFPKTLLMAASSTTSTTTATIATTPTTTTTTSKTTTATTPAATTTTTSRTTTTTTEATTPKPQPITPLGPCNYNGSPGSTWEAEIMATGVGQLDVYSTCFSPGMFAHATVLIENLAFGQCQNIPNFSGIRCTGTSTYSYKLCCPQNAAGVELYGKPAAEQSHAIASIKATVQSPPETAVVLPITFKLPQELLCYRLGGGALGTQCKANDVDSFLLHYSIL